MCATLAGYQAWKRGGTPNRKRLTDTQLLTLIRAIHAEFKLLQQLQE
jgi:putative transposase